MEHVILNPLDWSHETLERARVGRPATHPGLIAADGQLPPAGSLDEALAALASGPRTLLAGGTDIYPARVGRPVDDDILDVTGLPDLRAITRRRRRLPDPGPRDLDGPASGPTCRRGSTG